MTFGRWLLDFFLIAAGLGALAFFGGEKLPRRWFRPDAFPYRQAAWEQNGAVYEKLGIRVWKDIFPDMSLYICSAYRMLCDTCRLGHGQFFHGSILCHDQLPFGRKQTIFCKSSVSSGAQLIVMFTHSIVSCHAGVTFPAGDQRINGSLRSDQCFILFGSRCDNLSCELMTYGQRINSAAGTMLIGSRIIGTAYATGAHSDQKLFSLRYRYFYFIASEISDRM